MSRFFCTLFIFLISWSCTQVWGAGKGSTQPSGASRKIEEQLSRLSKNLINLQKSLEDVKAEKDRVCVAEDATVSQPYVKVYLKSFTHFIQDKTENLKVGGQALWSSARKTTQWKVPWEDWLTWGSILFKFLLAIGVGVGCGFFLHKWLQELVKVFSKWNKRVWQNRESIRDTVQFFVEITIAVLPPLVGAFLQVSSFFLLEETPLLRNGMLSLATGLLVWGSVWQIQRFLLKNPRKFFLLRYLSVEAQKSLVAKIQTFLFCLIVGEWAEELASLAGLPESAQKILMIFFGLGMVIAFFGLTQILKKPILKTLQAHNFQAFTFLTFLWTGIWNNFALLFYALFIIDETLLDFVFWPIIATLIFLPLVPFLYRALRRVHLTYLWRKRRTHQNMLFYRVLRANAQMDRAIKIFVYGIVAFCIIEIWDVNLLLWLRNLLGTKLYGQILDMIILSITAVTIVSVGDRLLRHYLEKSSQTDGTIEDVYLQGRLRTLLTVARTFLRIGVWVPYLLLSLSVFGHSVALILTSLGIFSGALLFGVQSLVKDFVTGFFILLDNSLIVGDQVEIDGRTGIVEDLSLRTLKIRADNGMLQTIPFGSITVIGNKSRYFSYVIINFSVSYDTEPEKAHQLLEKAYQVLRRNAIANRKILAPIEIRGIVEVSDYAIVFQARLKTAPGEQDFLRRAFNKALKQLCDEAGVRVPSPPYPLQQQKIPSLTSTVPSPTPS